jgi:hypothetical protein
LGSIVNTTYNALQTTVSGLSTTVSGLSSSVTTLQTKTQNQTAVSLNTTFSGIVTIGTKLVLSTAPKFNAYCLTNQSIPAGAYTILNFDNLDFNITSSYSTSTNRFTPNLQGYYAVNGTCFNGNTTNCNIAIFKNGAEYCRGDQITISGSSGASLNVSNCCIYMNGTTDYLDLRLFSLIISSTTCTIRSQQYFQGTYLHS